MATHSSILAWEIAWTEEHGGAQSMGWQRVAHDLVTNNVTLCFPEGSAALEALESTCSVGDTRDEHWNPVLGRSPGEGDGNRCTPVFLPENIHGQRSLAGYSP